jgi:hypothetical protein
VIPVLLNLGVMMWINLQHRASRHLKLNIRCHCPRVPTSSMVRNVYYPPRSSGPALSTCSSSTLLPVCLFSALYQECGTFLLHLLCRAMSNVKFIRSNISHEEQGFFIITKAPLSVLVWFGFGCFFFCFYYFLF